MVLFCLLFESFLISWFIHWFHPLYFTCFLSNSVWFTFLGASFRAFCIKLWLIMRTLSCLAGLMLFGSASCIPIHFAWHAIWLRVANVTLPICQHECDSWAVFVMVLLWCFLISLCDFAVFSSICMHQTLAKVSKYWFCIPVNNLGTFSFCMLVNKKKKQMHACYFFFL